MKILLEKIRKLLKDRRIRRIWYRGVSGFAALIVFITTYALVLPAITVEKNASCGIEEHQHDDSCYEERLICGQEESDGHHHDDSCYSVTKELVCEIEEHQHSVENGCYDEEGNLICELPEHVHDDSCYEEVKTLTCGQEESEGHHHTDACYEKVLACGKEVHTHSEKCYVQDDIEAASEDSAQNTSAAGTAGTDNPADTGTSAASEEADDNAAEAYVPQLDPLNMEAMLNKHTDMYYFHAEDGNSAEITDWQRVKGDTELASDDLVKMYLAYTIPAGSLNETNQTARYRLPENLHLTDEQIEAINFNENGIAAASTDSAADYKKYLGAEAVEGDRKPDETLEDGAQEYIGAVVKAENVYKNDRYVGQDLIFTFVPYSIEKNQNTYDAEGKTVETGEKITGWFACDFNLSQIDWEENENGESIVDAVDAEDADTDGNPDEKKVEKTAELVFAAEDKEENIEEISCILRFKDQSVEEKEENKSDDNEIEEDNSADSSTEEFKAGTLTVGGEDYNVILDYTEEAKIPEKAELFVHEITEQSDKDAYEECLSQAEDHVADSGEDKSSVDAAATRFFDIEIVVRDENGTPHKIEPAAPVNVRIQISDADTTKNASDNSKQDPKILHFSEDGIEQIESTTTETTAEMNNSDAASTQEEANEIRFEAESFSVYGVVYTADFHYEVDGKSYDFSIPGGGFISLESLVELLGVSKSDASDVNDLNAKSISEETKNFVEDVANVGFSSPELVWVGKIENDTTVGAIKKANELECQYSANLSEEQIAEINAQTVTAGDWALINMLPFTSEETLTVTMKNGNVWTVKVTDAQDDASQFNIAWTHFNPYAFPLSYSTSNVHIVYRDNLGNDITNKVTGSLSETMNTDDTIDLSADKYHPAIEGYTFQKARYQGAKITSVKAVTSPVAFSFVDEFYLYNGENLVTAVNVDPDQSIEIEMVYHNDTAIDPAVGGGQRPLPEGFNPDDLPPATADKTLVPNKDENGNPDGTYTLTLSVDVPERQAAGSGRANVVIIFDSSNSMGEPAKYKEDPNGKYGTWDGIKYGELELRTEWIGLFQRTYYVLFDPDTNETKEYTIDDTHKRYSADGDATRMSEAKEIVGDLASNLWQNNVKYGDGTVELGFVQFATQLIGPDQTNTAFGRADSLSEFEGWVRSCGCTDDWRGATNWEMALQAASSINFDGGADGEGTDDDQTYIIFVTDGNPTVRVSEPHDESDGDRIVVSQDWNGYQYINEVYPEGIWGTGNSDTERYNFAAAEKQAQAIADSGTIIFNVGIYGDATNMKKLTNHGYYDATDGYKMKEAFDAIAKKISARLGYSNVSITDGITSMTTPALSASTEGEASGFTYKVIQHTEDGDVDITEQEMERLPEASYAVTQATAGGTNYDKKDVVWNLGDNMLVDGATYSVSFVVWPDQDAYDLVSDLNNGIRKFSELSDLEKKQVTEKDGVYSLYSNTEANVKYTPVRQETDSDDITTTTPGAERTIPLEKPDPMGLADSTVKVQKEWNVSLDPKELEDFLEANPNYKVELDLMKDTGETGSSPILYIDDITISPIANEYVWPEKKDGKDVEHHISTGLMVSAAAGIKSGLFKDKDNDGVPDNTWGYSAVTFTENNTTTTYYILEKGRDYYFEENISSDYHFEYKKQIYHPMVVDGAVKDVTFNEDGSIASIADFTQILSALNVLKGGFNIHKVIVDEEGNEIEADWPDKETYFTIKGYVKKKVDGQYQGLSGENALKYRLIGNEYTDEDGKTGRSEKIAVADSQNIEIKIHAGDHIRIGNVPSGYEYEFYEVTPASDSGYSFYKIEGNAKVKIDGVEQDAEGANIAVSADHKLTGTTIPNAAQNVIVKNNCQELLTDFSFKKVWAAEDADLSSIVRGKMNVWGQNNAINVTLHRIAKGAENPDSTFALTYEIGSGEGPFKPTNSGLSEEDKTKYQLTKTKTDDGKITTFTLSKNLDLADNNYAAYTYYVVEDSASGSMLYNTYYGKENEDGTVSRANGASKAKKSEVIINQEYCGVELPSTGGHGTRKIYLTGILFTVLAAAGFVIRRRRNTI